MKGYYIITTNEEPIEVVGRNARKRAIELALEIFHEHQDHDIIVQQFNDDNPDGYMAGLELLHTKNFKVPFLLRKKAKELLGRAATAEVTITICVREQRMPSALYKSDGACYKIAWEIQDIAAIEVK